MMRQLTSLDAAFIYMEGDGKHNHLTGVYIYDQSTVSGGMLRFKDILAHVEERLQHSPVFRQKLLPVPMSMDYPYWVDDPDFDVEFHVRHIALPRPGDWRQFCILVARLHSRPLDMTRPAWEMYIVEGLDNIDHLPSGCFAVVSKYHHAAVDGATGVELLGALNDTTSDASSSSKSRRARYQPALAPARFSLMRKALWNNLRQPFLLTRSVSLTLPPVARYFLGRIRTGAGERLPVPDTRFNGKVSAHRVFEGREFDLGIFRAIKNAVPGTTVNDVVLAVVAGALRRFLREHDELPEAPLVAAVPISSRGEHDDSPGNQVTIMTCALATDVDEPRQRLLNINASTRSSKATVNAIGARQMTDIQKHLPSATLALVGRLVNGMALGSRARFCNVVVTNVPGPQIPLYFCGARMVGSWGCGPVTDGVGLLILATSYHGKMFISLSSCREMLPEIAELAKHMQIACDELVTAC
ncbi:MAG: WS/DGAT/MGAT family O-acyltransferase, partial [Parahaliea sp.]